MGLPAAKKDDQVVGVDVHIVIVPAPPGSPVPTPLPHPFSGILDGSLSSNVKIMGKPAATVGSTATNKPSHAPTPPGTAFQKPPTNKANITRGSSTVKINGKAAARLGDAAMSCTDQPYIKEPTVVAAGTVFIGG